MKHALSGVLRGLPAHAPHVRCRSACCRTSGWAVLAVPVACALLAVILAFGLHVNLSASAPRGLYRMVAGRLTRGAWVAVCVSSHSAALARARGYLIPGPCAGGVQPAVKPVVALAGDVVESGPEAVTVDAPSSQQLGRRRRQPGPRVAACGVGALRRRSGRALARQHAGSGQLGQWRRTGKPRARGWRRDARGLARARHEPARRRRAHSDRHGRRVPTHALGLAVPLLIQAMTRCARARSCLSRLLSRATRARVSLRQEEIAARLAA